jgi:hypothetical protein
MVLSLSFTAFAGECVMTVDRKPCPGKEAEALKPYAGKNPTEDKADVEVEASCLSKAEKASKIIRKGTLIEKTVTAKFNGKDLGKTFHEKSECK